jgi:branched-chain amino acid transport system substrate-binding protein
MTLKTPTGDVKLDSNRQAIGANFVTEVSRAPDGSFFNKVVLKVNEVNQLLNQTKAEFDAVGLGTRDAPSCP